MPGNSGGGAPSQQTINQSNLPEYARPYFERLMARTEAESNRPYEAYTGPRVASFSPTQERGFQAVDQIASRGNPTIDAASGLAGQATARAMQGANFQASPIGVGMFDTATAQRYMSPYQDAVIGRQKDAAIRDFAEGQAGRDDPAIRTGAFGGYRDMIRRGVEERGLQNRLSDIEAQGRQSAFENAQGQFERDRAAGFTAAATNEANRRAAAQTQQQALSLGLGGAQTLGGLGQMDQTLALQRAGALREVGDQEYAQQQRYLDTAFSDFQNQRDFGRQQLNFYGGMLRGVPVTPVSEVSQYTNPNPLNQALGLGIAGLGAYRAMR